MTTSIVPDQIESTSLATLDDERLKILREQIAPGASEAELAYFISSAARNNLDPFAVPQQIAAMPSRVNTAHKGQPEHWITKFVPVVMIDGWRKKLMDTGRVEDIEIEWAGADGVWRDMWPSNDGLVAARASIYIVGRMRPIRFVAHLDEFIKYKLGSNEPTETWKRTRHMIAVRSLSHAAKQALVGTSFFTPDLLTEADEFDDRGNAQRRFWAAGWSEDTVRRALHVGDDEDLSAAIERYGGYAKLEAYMAVKGPVVATLPPSTLDEQRRDAQALYAPEYEPEGEGRDHQSAVGADVNQHKGSAWGIVAEQHCTHEGVGMPGCPICDPQGAASLSGCGPPSDCVCDPIVEGASLPRTFANSVDLLKAAKDELGLADSQAVTKALGGDAKWKAATSAEDLAQFWARLTAPEAAT